MASFYYPNRGAPTTTLTIEHLESYPSKRDREILQSRKITPGGTAITYNLGVTIQFLEIRMDLLTSAQRTSLISFIDNQAQGAANSFDYTDDKGNNYDGCFFWFDKYDFQEEYHNLFSDVLLIRVNP